MCIIIILYMFILSMPLLFKKPGYKGHTCYDEQSTVIILCRNIDSCE